MRRQQPKRFARRWKLLAALFSSSFAAQTTGSNLRPQFGCGTGSRVLNINQSKPSLEVNYVLEANYHR
jgi:hypothetical protein